MATRVALHPFLAGMNRSQLNLLTDCAMAVNFTPGELIFREGELANRFYLIESGKVTLESSGRSGDPVIVDNVGAGGLLGWSWMFPPYVWHFTARAVEPTKAIFFYGTILREYCEHDHSLGYELFKHERRDDQTAASRAGKNARDRFASDRSPRSSSNRLSWIRSWISLKPRARSGRGSRGSVDTNRRC
jgi:CRP-like cAMP-binding protein